jgi:hypothetical protein
MFDDIEEFDGNPVDFLLSIKEEIEATGDPDMIAEFQKLEEEAIGFVK